MTTSAALLHEKIFSFAARGEEPLPPSVIADLFPVVGFLNQEKKKKLEDILQITIQTPSIFEQALIHRSYLQVLFSPQAQQPLQRAYSNERLEFLGDAILSYITAEFLFYMRADFLEGE